MAIVFVPTVAVIGVSVVEKAPPLFEYSMLQVPVPPPLSVTDVKVKDCPAQTVATFGDFVAVGAEGSATTVQEYVVTEEVSQPEPEHTCRMAIVLVPTVAENGVSVFENAPPL